MKTTNLFAAQQKYIPPQERKTQTALKYLPFTPLILCVLMMIPALGRPEALRGSVIILVDMLFISLLFAFMVKQLKKKFLKRFSAEQLERIDKECQNAPQKEGFMVTSDALMYFMPAIIALPMQDLVWVYALEQTHNKGVFLSKTYYAIVAVTRDKKSYTLLRGTRSTELVNQVMRFLHEHLTKFRPHVIFGHTEALDTMRKKDFARMVQIADSGANSEDMASFAQDICAIRQEEVFRA